MIFPTTAGAAMRDSRRRRHRTDQVAVIINPVSGMYNSANVANVLYPFRVDLYKFFISDFFLSTLRPLRATARDSLRFAKRTSWDHRYLTNMKGQVGS
jgi:hypothetical protein